MRLRTRSNSQKFKFTSVADAVGDHFQTQTSHQSVYRDITHSKPWPDHKRTAIITDDRFWNTLPFTLPTALSQLQARYFEAVHRETCWESTQQCNKSYRRYLRIDCKEVRVPRHASLKGLLLVKLIIFWHRNFERYLRNFNAVSRKVASRGDIFNDKNFTRCHKYTTGVPVSLLRVVSLFAVSRLHR